MNAVVETQPTSQVEYMSVGPKGNPWRGFYEHLLAHRVYDLKTKPEHSFLHRMFKLGMERNAAVFDHHYIAYHDGKFCAIATINRYRGKNLVNVYVHPEYQRRGIARDFMAMARKDFPVLHGVYTPEGSHLYQTQGVIKVDTALAVDVWNSYRQPKG